jgi:hypothetical protein
MVETNNLFVETLAVRSPLAAEDDEQRFIRRGGEKAGRGVVGEPVGGVCREKKNADFADNAEREWWDHEQREVLV